MTLKNTAIALSIAGLGLIAGSGQAQAAIVGTQGVADLGNPTINTGSLSTATVFNLGSLFTSTAQTGVFIGVPQFTAIGPVSFTSTNPTSFSFANAVLGSFASTSIVALPSTSTSAGFNIFGNFTNGPVGPTPTPASFTISFTQTALGAISDSGTLSIPPVGTAVPEPSEVLGTLAFGGIVAGGLLKRKIGKLA